jgi:ABC-2 type transport system permease protein
MKNLTYLKFEVLRTLRNRRFLIFALIFPLVLFFAIAGPNKNVIVEGIHFPLYYMTAMASWGAMTAMLSSGARIAAERQIGWTRQMKITPLSTRSYFSAKVLCGYMMAFFTIIALGIAGSILGVHLSALEWLKMVALLVVGLIPFAVIGILLGHLMKVDSLGPALGGVTSLFALLGGSFVGVGAKDRAHQREEGQRRTESHDAVGHGGVGVTMRDADPPGREGHERQPEEQQQVGPHDTRADAPRRAQEVVVIVPVDGDHREAEYVDEQLRHPVPESVPGGAQGCLEFEGHDRDDHRHHPVAEGLHATGIERDAGAGVAHALAPR